MPYTLFPTGKLPPSGDKSTYDSYPYKSSAGNFNANTLPLISGPTITIMVVEKPRKNIEGKVAMKKGESSADKNTTLPANTSESEASNDKKENQTASTGSGNEKATTEESKVRGESDSRSRSLTRYLSSLNMSRKSSQHRENEPVPPERFLISQPLLQARSPYWVELLKEAESTTEPLEIKAMPGTVSPQSVSMLFHWWYREDLVWSDLESHSKNEVSNMIELAHLVEHWQVNDPNLELYITTAVKHVITKHGKHKNHKFFSDEHIDSVFSLRQGHMLQDLLIMAAMEPYFGKDERGYVTKILNRQRGAEWLLQWVHITMNSISSSGKESPTFKDPFSGQRVTIMSELKRY